MKDGGNRLAIAVALAVLALLALRFGVGAGGVDVGGRRVSVRLGAEGCSIDGADPVDASTCVALLQALKPREVKMVITGDARAGDADLLREALELLGVAVSENEE